MEMFYEIVFMRVITSILIAFMMHYLIYRSVVTAVICKYPFLSHFQVNDLMYLFTSATKKNEKCFLHCI